MVQWNGLERYWFWGFSFVIPQTVRLKQFFWMILKCSLFLFLYFHWKILKLIYLISICSNFKSFILINVQITNLGWSIFFSQGLNSYTEKIIVQLHQHRNEIRNEIRKVHDQDMICYPKTLPVTECIPFYKQTTSFFTFLSSTDKSIRKSCWD